MSPNIWRRSVRPEGFVLLLALGLVLSAWAFLEIADEVREGERERVDATVMRWFRRPDNLAVPIGPAWLVESAKDLTALGGPTVLTLAVLAVCGYLALAGPRTAIGIVLAAALGGLGVSTLLKIGFDRARPDVVPHLAPAFTASFPSGHSMLAAIIYLTLGALVAGVAPRRRAQAYVLGVALLLALLIGVSRVYLGVHWPTDVLAGWAAGLAWASLCWIAVRVLQPT